jgi:hypothetical protein
MAGDNRVWIMTRLPVPVSARRPSVYGASRTLMAPSFFFWKIS